MKQLPLSNEGALPWWHALCALAALNVCAWLGIWLFGPARDTYSTLQLTLSGAYVFVCAYRSILPRVDLERRVVVDSVVSSIFLGRSAATIAEVCFGVQLGLLIYELGAYAGLPGVQETAWVVTLCTVLAQGFCWHSILTLNHITQAVESLLWALGFSWMTALLIVVAMDTGGVVHALALAGVLASSTFVVYVLFFDVPLYLRRFNKARAHGQRYLSVQQGLRDAWFRREPDHSWDNWRADALWLTPYFSVGVWISMALVFVPLALS